MSALKNHKHEAFCQEYLRDRNAKAAAIRVGYSERSATSTGFDLLQRDDIKERIAELSAAYLAEVRKDAASVLRMIVTQAETGLGTFISFRADGDPFIDLSAASKAQLDTLQEVTIETYMEGNGEGAREVKRVKIKAGDRLKAIDKLWEYTSLAKTHEDDKASALVAAIDQLARARGSAMPIGNPAPQDEDDA